MLSIFYQKNENTELFKALEANGIVKPQNYIPLYKNFFSFSPQNYNRCNLNHQYHIQSIKSLENSNKYDCIVNDNSNNKRQKTTFFKFSPLLDPIKYMAGKYVLNTIDLTALPILEGSKCHKKVLDPNNSAYADSFFSYLSSEVLHKHNVQHCIDFFGSFLGIKSDFSVNIFDDLDYLSESDFFGRNCNKLFKINNTDFPLYLRNSTRNNFKKININLSDDTSSHNLNVLDISNILFKDIFEKRENINKKILGDISNNLVFKSVIEIKKNQHSNSRLSDSTYSSKSSHTSNEHSDSDSGSDSDDGSDDGSDATSSTCSSNADDMLEVILYNFPIQVICLECLDYTLDSCLSEGSELNDEEWRSCLFQIIMTLIIYQKLFNFTHNDLHTNNIMFQATDRKYLYYKYDNKHYKVPTYGRIFKIIDFGRAIYKYKGKVICSDSFHPKGDAATQYNCEPYLNKNKPRLEPNMSFDLCRLACSLFDYFVDDIEELGKIKDPIAKIIIQWCKDDKGRNILYKTNGEERYPDFKLYKMIARTVHKHTPQIQIEHPLFQKYVVGRKQMPRKARILNVDQLPVYTD